MARTIEMNDGERVPGSISSAICLIAAAVAAAAVAGSWVADETKSMPLAPWTLAVLIAMPLSCVAGIIRLASHRHARGVLDRLVQLVVWIEAGLIVMFVALAVEVVLFATIFPFDPRDDDPSPVAWTALLALGCATCIAGTVFSLRVRRCGTYEGLRAVGALLAAAFAFGLLLLALPTGILLLGVLRRS